MATKQPDMTTDTKKDDSMQDDSMQVFVRNLAGKTITINELKPTDSVEVLKSKIQVPCCNLLRTAAPPERSRALCGVPVYLAVQCAELCSLPFCLSAPRTRRASRHICSA